MEKILLISLKLNFTPNTLSGIGFSNIAGLIFGVESVFGKIKLLLSRQSFGSSLPVNDFFLLVLFLNAVLK